jgi:hypothetical protein
LKNEARRQAMKTDFRLRDEERRKWRRIYMENRRRPDKKR